MSAYRGGAYASNPSERSSGQSWGADRKNPNTSFKRGGAGDFEQPSGRWPANFCHNGSSDVAERFPSVAGSKGSGMTQTPARSWKNASKAGINRVGYEDDGSAARFFYVVQHKG